MFDQMSEAGGRRSARDAAVDRLTAVMGELSTLPIESAATRGNLAEVAVLERARSWASARQARVLAALVVAEPADYDPDSDVLPSPRATTPQEIALVLRVSTATVRGRLAVARGLVEDFPATLAAASDGMLPWWQARRALEETTELSPAARGAVDRDLAAHAAAGRSPARFGPRLRAAILHADPATAEQEHLHALADRAVSVDPHPNGTVTVAATVAAETGGVFLEMVDRLADTPLSIPPPGWPVDGRTADQRRADTLHGLSHAVLAGLDTIGTPGSAGPDTPGAADLDTADTAGSAGLRAAAQRAVAAVLEVAGRDSPAGPGSRRRSGRRLRRAGEVLVTVSAETLLGISDAPGDLDGHGPISAGHARRLAHAADTWRRLLTDPVTGAVLDVGRTRYTPTTPIAEHVLTRSNRRCTRPGCPRPVAHLDHAQPWAQDGPTAAGNLTGLCVGDHRARHTGWTVTISPDGATTLTTRHGFTTTTPPHDHRPQDRRPADHRPPDRRPADRRPADRQPPTRQHQTTQHQTRRHQGRPTAQRRSTRPVTPSRRRRCRPLEKVTPSSHRRRYHRAPGRPDPPPAHPADDPPPSTPASRRSTPTAAHTNFPTPAPSGVGDPHTGRGWLTDMHTYITTTHNRACANRVDASPPPNPPTAPREQGTDDPAPF